jgi:signal transduction histidine kinase/ActR/RegA family two-component response regulator
MPPAPPPPNEPERLASVRRLGELGHASRATETILSLLREQMLVNRAFLNIVNETTQHPFLCDPHGPQSTPRDTSFCGHVVSSNAPVIVPDAARDPRFSDNPAVTSGQIRFYYGAPVYTPEGHAAGALCVQGPEPRQPTDLEISLLRRLADLVTEELRLARRFAETEQHFRDRHSQLGQLIAATPASLAVLDTELRYLAASDRWRSRWITDDRPIRGLSMYDHAPWIPARWKEFHRRCLAGETIECEEDRLEWPDGEVEFARWRLVPWKRNDGAVGGLIIFTENITESALARDALEQSNERLRLAINSARAALWDWDVRADRIFRDPLWWEVHGHEPGSLSETASESVHIIHPDDMPSLRERTVLLLSGERDHLAHESRMRDAQGRWAWYAIHAVAAERDDEGRASRVIGLNLCVDDRKRLEFQRMRQTEDLAAAKVALEEQAERLLTATREARDARRAAEEANEAKSRFLANMSHEIRTPMAAILGYTEILSDPRADDASRADALATIRRNGEHLINLINEILDLSKIEAGRMQVERVRCDPRVILRESVKMVADQAARKGLSVGLDTDPSLPETLHTDPTRLRQVLTNLIGNAVKFTERGTVRIRAGLDDGGACRFEVEDTGIGMPADVAARVFEPFVQADASTTRRHGGTGLGLTISAHLAQMLGGALTVARSEPGRGTTMRLTIDPGQRRATAPKPSRATPAAHPGSSATPPESTTVLSGARILLAEDGPDNQRLLQYMLSRAGIVVTIVPDGVLALEAIPDACNPGFDLILLDMQMPEMDGYETARTLRTRGVRIPIIALTANAMDGDRDRCLAAGCDDYASKPIGSNELHRICARWLHASASENRAAA